MPPSPRCPRTSSLARPLLLQSCSLMDLAISNIPAKADESILSRAIAHALRSEDYSISFHVSLSRQNGVVPSAGNGILTLPTYEAGRKFLASIAHEETIIEIDGHEIDFSQIHGPPRHSIFKIGKTQRIPLPTELGRLRVDKIQLGTFYRTSYPSNDKGPLVPRAFSIEWEYPCAYTTEAWLFWEPPKQLIRIKIGNEISQTTFASIVVPFSSIQKVGIGYDGVPYVCFDTSHPPMIEESEFHRPLTGNRASDLRKCKQRIAYLHPGHKNVGQYAHDLRIILYKDPNADVVDKFIALGRNAGFSPEKIVRCTRTSQIDASRQGFFTDRRLRMLRKQYKDLPWRVCFQLEALLSNGLLHTPDLLELIELIRGVSLPLDSISDILRHFAEALVSRPARESPIQCFRRLQHRNELPFAQLPPYSFLCHHGIFTPSRRLFKGPYPVKSNHVIREYQGYEDYFMRVEFRDEDMLVYREDHEVDSRSVIAQCVGGIMKHGFDVAGRQYEFLGYSMSSLRNHAVWFMSPFDHPKKGRVSSEAIRYSLGEFQGTSLLRWPSKYAARLAQSFTATAPSVAIHRGQWTEVDDLGSQPYQFTDGAGTISRCLGDRIWETLCISGCTQVNHVRPSAYQIRFLGYKGVVSVDKHMDENDGIIMRLRPSMRKFETSQKEATIEIVKAFDRPETCYLNRPLVAVLEGLGVKKDAFLELQDIAVANIHDITESNSQFAKSLVDHKLGEQYNLPSLLKQVDAIRLLAPRCQSSESFQNSPLLQQVQQVSRSDILRNIKHGARVLIPDSFLLVGVPDEGPAYQKAGHPDVFVLPENHIYVCVQGSDDLEPIWLSGPCSISRSPVVHPGDVRRVKAIGKPPENMLCLFGHMRNVVVLPSVGSRSLASCLGGGDVDGDTYSIIAYPPLLPSEEADPAEYPESSPVDIQRETTVQDICDFFISFMISDVLVGLICPNLGISHIDIVFFTGPSVRQAFGYSGYVPFYPHPFAGPKKWRAFQDQPKQDGTHDATWHFLARMCSEAVDYPKQGIPVDIDHDKLPRTMVGRKPDWRMSDVPSCHAKDSYQSNRALGHMYRSINVTEPDVPIVVGHGLVTHELTTLLTRRVAPYLYPSLNAPAYIQPDLAIIFRNYVQELTYICSSHSLSQLPGAQLLEAEVVAGTILMRSSQKQWRLDRLKRMKVHTAAVVGNIRGALFAPPDPRSASQEELTRGLQNGWRAWEFCESQGGVFGAGSFGFVALGIVFECWNALSAERPRDIDTVNPGL
ncbi:RNA-dependent RNA polymerase 1 [Hypsizygus marmoreus]|uniref:RNA-dependent RNA polymerase n=1 Tax=Hypsizygus marmoreus TaxID=39966 RepID=A0A369JN38_HYPMA|nr:RNA-dependent RNA polymerase 1 [Hypsizygus marmoreus]